MPTRRTKPVYKSAKTGRFIAKSYLKGHPGTTVTEQVAKGRKKKRR